MDEMEKEGFEEAFEAENPETDKNENELEKELNELKDLFQRELDKAAEGEADDENEEGELIQECDDASPEEDSEEQTDEELPLCECCEEKPCSTEHGEGYPYCDDCRKLMIKYPVRFSGVLTFILTIVLFVAGFFVAGNEILDASIVTEASTAYSSGHITTAYNAFNQYFSNHYSKYTSKRAVREAVDTCMSLGAVGNVISIVEEHYTPEQIEKLSDSNEIKKAYKLCKEIDATTSAVYQSIVYPATIGYTKVEDAVKELEKFSAEIDKQGEKSEYNKIVTEYYIYSLLLSGDYDQDVRYKKITDIAEMAGDDYKWLYASALAMAAAEKGELDVVTECTDIIKENNRDDVVAYTALAQYYAKQKKIDAKKLLEVCAEADAAFPSGTEKSHYRYYAIAYLLDGEQEKALEKMESYLENGLQYYSDANLYALCGLANGNDEIYKQMEETLAGYGGKYKLSDLLTKYKKGKISIEKIFETSGGDFV